MQEIGGMYQGGTFGHFATSDLARISGRNPSPR
jgi:hypothetical protein